MDECTRVFPTGENLFERIFKSPCEDSALKLYHDVTLDLANVCTPSLAVHPAIDEARA